MDSEIVDMMKKMTDDAIHCMEVLNGSIEKVMKSEITPGGALIAGNRKEENNLISHLQRYRNTAKRGEELAKELRQKLIKAYSHYAEPKD